MGEDDEVNEEFGVPLTTILLCGTGAAATAPETAPDNNDGFAVMLGGEKFALLARDDGDSCFPLLLLCSVKSISGATATLGASFLGAVTALLVGEAN